MFNITLMTIVSLVTIGIVELIKVFLPENAGSKIKGMISLEYFWIMILVQSS